MAREFTTITVTDKLPWTRGDEITLVSREIIGILLVAIVVMTD